MFVPSSHGCKGQGKETIKVVEARMDRIPPGRTRARLDHINLPKQANCKSFCPKSEPKTKHTKEAVNQKSYSPTPPAAVLKLPINIKNLICLRLANHHYFISKKKGVRKNFASFNNTKKKKNSKRADVRR